jgi:hypothetical protein
MIGSVAGVDAAENADGLQVTLGLLIVALCGYPTCLNLAVSRKVRSGQHSPPLGKWKGK